MFVKKVDGRLEEFDGNKIINTCIRSGISKSQADSVLANVKKKAYDKMTTKELLQMILLEIRKYSVASSMKYNLRAALANLSPEGMFFEKYIKRLLEEHDYSVEWSKIVKGRCVEHEVDLIAKDGKITAMIECKHHSNHHAFTGLGDAMETWAKWEDARENNKFDEAWLVCNTKMSDHAVKYATCKGIKLMCWNYSLGLPKLIELIDEKKFYPITILESVQKTDTRRAFEQNVLTVRDVINAGQPTLRKIFGDPKAVLLQAEEILRS
ncbi:MAG: restriction endonuclease [Candidatus Aenigmatarchaeota archaeon]